jgi:hypothetical protein
MVNPDKDDEEEKPLDPAVARVQAKLQRLMLIAGLTLGIGILAVFLAIIYRITAGDDKVPIAAEETSPKAIAGAPLAEPPNGQAPAASEDSPQQEDSAEDIASDNPADATAPTALPPVAVAPAPRAEVGGVAPGTPAAVLAVEASIPADARLIASTVAGGRIVLTYDHFGGTIVIVVDPDTLQVVGRLDLKPE